MRQIRDKLMKIRFSNTYASCRTHTFRFSRATVVLVEIITAATAISQIADPIPADRYNFELPDRNIAITVSSRYRGPRD